MGVATEAPDLKVQILAHVLKVFHEMLTGQGQLLW
jgi:hypothetical protein